jgi:predicted AAA+ superfamily ATPase
MTGVQKVPELLAVIHHLIEEKQGHTFILTGSSARKLKKTGVDMLGGRTLLNLTDLAKSKESPSSAAVRG